MKTKSKTGTREWSEYSVNCCKGCSNGCIYCYARDMALRYKRIPNGQAWETEQINARALTKKHGKYDGVVMFPTTHDITPTNLEACLTVLTNLLEAGNQVLIVSKPKIACITRLCCMLKNYQSQIEFRFSIGTYDDFCRMFWEPNASTIGERIMCLRFVRDCGYNYSVSCEPSLEPWKLTGLVKFFDDFFNKHTIWIGCANKLIQRCVWKLPADDPHIVELLKWQTPEKIMEVYEQLKDNPRIRWKDSYQKVIDAKEADDGKI